jgi:hypothetical protein
VIGPARQPNRSFVQKSKKIPTAGAPTSDPQTSTQAAHFDVGHVHKTLPCASALIIKRAKCLMAGILGSMHSFFVLLTKRYAH